MNFEKRNEIVNRIISGYFSISVKNKIYKVYDPNAYTKYIADIYYSECLENYILDGVINNEETSFILKEKEIWKTNLDEEISELHNDNKKLLKSLVNYQFQEYKKRDIENKIEQNTKKINSLSKEKNTLSSNTAEYLARIEKYKKLLFLNTYYDNDNKVWNNWDDFINAEDSLVRTLLSKSYFSDFLNETDFREIARSDPWRTYWKLSVKTGTPLFPHSSIEMTDLQKVLVSWSSLYDSIYESVDCPDDSIIENDLLLDSWLINQKDKNKDKNDITSITKNPKILNSQEIGIVVDTPEDAEKVYNLNSNKSKKILEERSKALAKHGKLQEADLPDVKRRLILEKNARVNNGK